MPDKLTPKQEAFVLAYLKTSNASEAYRKAYDAGKMSDESVHVEACRLLANPKVALRVASVQSKAEERALISKEWVITRLVENVQRAMQAEPVKDPDGSPTGEYRYEGSVANRALELLGKELKMFVDRKEVGKPGEFDNMDADELRRHIAAEAEALGVSRAAPKAPRGNGKAGSLPN
jgi:phage terminase small subunit